MPTRSADNMVASLMIDVWPRNAAVVDYGITEENIGAYQDAIRLGKLTADDLHAHIYNSAWLSEQIGAPVDTGLDILLTANFDEGEEEGDDEETRIEEQALANLDAMADYPDSDYSRPDPEDEIDPVNYYDDYEIPEEPITKTLRLGPALFTVMRNPDEKFPDFSQMTEDEILAWITR